MNPDYIIGLDIGQARDYTALAVIERPPRIPDRRDKPVYSLRHLVRYPLNTPYTTIVPAVAKLTSNPPPARFATRHRLHRRGPSAR